jgi:hypothetical protein
MTTPDDRGLVALKLMHLAMEWIEARVDLLPEIPSVLIYPTYRNVTIGFGYYSDGSETLGKILDLFKGQTAKRTPSDSVWAYEIGDKTNGICFTWYVWREAYDLSEETEVTL